MLAEKATFTADFYNNVAAIAVVLLFTKVVAHRSRKTPRGVAGTWILAVVHLIALLAAAAAIFASLWATDYETTDYNWMAQLGLAMAGGALLVDIAVDELCDARSTKSDDSGK